jgi:ribA/ribD-fused uncharacterized protein
MQILEDQVTSVTGELQTAKNEIVTLKSENVALRDRVVQLDSYSRRNNLIFYGLRQNTEEDCSLIVKTLMIKQLGLENANAVKFERCHRLRIRVDPQPIIVRFNWYQDRNMVWQSRSKLKGTNISMREDFPPEIIDQRKTLLPILKRARDLKKKAVLVAEKLYIDDRMYTVSNLHTLPQNLDPARLATRRVGNVTAFYSKSSPLSNFYEVNVKIDNEVFATVEQYLQYRKALHAERPDVASQIKNTRSPALCKKYGDSIKIEDKAWLPVAKEVLLKSCTAKFNQNTRAKMFLLSTDETVLAEATRDRFWGIGLSLDSKELAEQSKWTGANAFGDILMIIRDRIRSLSV